MQEQKNFFQRYIKKLPLAFFILLAALVALVAFGMLAHEVLGENEDSFDYTILAYFHNHVITSQLTPIAEAITFMGSSTFLLPSYIILILFHLYKKQKSRAIEIFMIGLIGIAITFLMKLSYHRARPDKPLVSPLKSFSFPSGHAMSAFVFYGLLTYLVWKTHLSKTYKVIATVVLVTLAVAVGLSRVYLRVHYPSDVLAGFCLGFAWICFAIWILKRIKNKAQKETGEKAQG